MSVTSDRSVTINWSQDVTYQQTFEAVTSTTGPGWNQLVSVTTGLVITIPSNAVAVTIIPPVANTTALTIKGVTGDTGIGIGASDPSSFALSTTQTTLVLAAASTTSGVRVIFS